MSLNFSLSHSSFLHVKYTVLYILCSLFMFTAVYICVNKEDVWSIFGHVARMSPNIPAHQALRLQVETSLGKRPDRYWVRSCGRPRNRWIDQLRQDHQRQPADLWRAAIQRGHTGATLRSSTTTRWRRRRRSMMMIIIIIVYLWPMTRHTEVFVNNMSTVCYGYKHLVTSMQLTMGQFVIGS